MDKIIRDKFFDVEDRVDIDESNLTPIQEFYKDAKIFITGATGFLGHILVEKLLRSCPVSKLYLLIRSKKGKESDARLEEILNDHLFDRMKKACPNYRQKIVLINGDSSLPELGISAQDKKLILDEVNMVFHVAATVRFDEHLTIATAINVKSTLEMCRLARSMPQLKCFVQVSTAFSNCVRDMIEEKIYPAPMHHDALINLTDTFDKQLINVLTPSLVKNYPNTYVFTKQIAEGVVKEETRGMPASIFRPSVVISTYKEPARGWINNIYGPTGIFYGVGLGLLRVFRCDLQVDANMVPVDMCVNGLIASAWDTAEKFKQATEDNEECDIPIYHYESSNDKPITWKDFANICDKYGLFLSPLRALWPHIMFTVKSYPRYLLLAFFLHLVPGAIADAVMFLKGKKVRIVAGYRKLNFHIKLLSHFSIKQLLFKSKRVQDMVRRMSEKDLDVFFCDIRNLDWDEYLMTYVAGVRVYLYKDPLDTVPAARRRMRWLRLANGVLVMLVGVLALTLLWSIASGIFRLFF